ncbi:MAG: FAD binding domain-containing protein [Gammaproteobacteria bacterium]
MLLPEHSYHKPDSLSECLATLGEFGERSQVIAGGTDVIFNMRLRFFEPEHLISVRRLPELQQIEELEGGGVRIGAACRLVDLADSPIIAKHYPALKEAIDAVASVHVRNIGTLGGNICLQTRCWFTNNSEEWRKGRDGCFKTDCEHCHVIQTAHRCHAINNADTPLALIALNATLTLQKSGRSREVPIAEFYLNDGMDFSVLEPDELLTHITIPPCTDRTVFIKFTPRKGMDFSLGAIAARCDGAGEELGELCVVLGSISSAPVILDKPAQMVVGQGLSDASIEAALEEIRGELGEVTNLYARAGYKKQIAKALVRRALVALREQ